MSENAFKNELKCLHCGTKDSEFHDIFDEVGTELQLDKLVKQHFKIPAKQNSPEKQLLCDDCVNKLIQLFDVEQLKKEKQSKAGDDDSVNSETGIKNEITVASLFNEVLSENENDQTTENEREHNYVVFPQNNSNDEAVIQGAEIPYDQIENYNDGIAEVVVDDYTEVNVDNDEDIEVIDTDTVSSKALEEDDDVYNGNVQPKLEASDETDFVTLEAITEGLDYVNIDTYLDEAIKSNLDNLQFKWQTFCGDCEKEFETFEELHNHVRDVHQLKDNDYRCILKDCDTIVSGENLLARHLILKHCDLHNLHIYGYCPDCNFRYSNFTVFNKHSCCRILKRRRGMRLYCDLCDITFPSFRRYVFHTQFHLEKRRPKICLICDQSFADIDEFFEHVHYSHEPEGTLACNICDRIFREAQVFEDHRHSHNQEAIYECKLCPKKFRNKNYLVQHMSSGHDAEQMIACDFCDKVFPSELSHRKHVKIHSLESDVLASVCSNCGMIAGDREYLMLHTQDMETNCYGAPIDEEVITSAFNCEFCSMDFKSKCDLKLHRSTGIHNDGKYWCLTCKKTFKSVKVLRNHNKHKVNPDGAAKIAIMRMFMCNFGDCEETYTQWNSLYTHKKRAHTYPVKSERDLFQNEDGDGDGANGSWICQFCDKSCPTKMSRSVHIARRHNNRNIECQYCNASYKDQAALEKHINYMHIPIECQVCHKVVKNQRNFDVHERVVHLKDQRYFCGVCSKGFYHKSDKEAHEKLHNSKYRCKECAFTTHYANSLEIHVASLHNKEYGYQCHICSKEFGRKHALNIHIKRHDQKREYICSNRIENGCKKAFVTNYLLNKHIRERHAGRGNNVGDGGPPAKRLRRSRKAKLQIIDNVDDPDCGEYLDYEEIAIEQLIEEEQFDEVEVIEQLEDNCEEEGIEQEFKYIVCPE